MRWLLIGVASLGLLAAASSRSEAAADDAHAPQAATAGHGETAHAAEPNILELKPALAICTALVFLTLFATLWKFAWGPLSKALDDRERYRQETLDKAESARAEGERMLAEHRLLMAKAGDDVRAILDEARRDAEALANGIVAKAQQEATASKERAERDISTARDQALAEIWTRTADLAVNVAGKVLARELSSDEQRRLINAAVEQLPSAAAPNGRGGRA